MGCFFFFFQAEDGIRDVAVTGVQTCALPIFSSSGWCRAFETVSAMMCARSLQERRNSGENHKDEHRDRKSTRLNSSHGYISYAVFCLKKKNTTTPHNNKIETTQLHNTYYHKSSTTV